MPMTEAQRDAMLAEFNAETFAPLDLSAFPSIAPEPVPETHDDRWSRDWRDTPLNASASALRAFVTDPPLDVLDRVGEETGNADFRADVRDQRGELVARQFERARPEYLMTDRNYAAMVETMAWNYLSHADQQEDIDTQVEKLIEAKAWTVDHLVAVHEPSRRKATSMWQPVAREIYQVPSGSRLQDSRRTDT
jgi:hypothetical protein